MFNSNTVNLSTYDYVKFFFRYLFWWKDSSFGRDYLKVLMLDNAMTHHQTTYCVNLWNFVNKTSSNGNKYFDWWKVKAKFASSILILELSRSFLLYVNPWILQKYFILPTFLHIQFLLRALTIWHFNLNSENNFIQWSVNLCFTPFLFISKIKHWEMLKCRDNQTMNIFCLKRVGVSVLKCHALWTFERLPVESPRHKEGYFVPF